MTRAKLMFYFGYHGTSGEDVGKPLLIAPSRDFFSARAGGAIERTAGQGRPCAVIHETVFTLDEESDPAALDRLLADPGGFMSIKKGLGRFKKEMDDIWGGLMSCLDDGEASCLLQKSFSTTFGYLDPILEANRRRSGSVLNFIEPQSVATISARLYAVSARHRLSRALAVHVLEELGLGRAMRPGSGMLELAKDCVNCEILSAITRDIEVARLAEKLSDDIPGITIIIPRGAMHLGMSALFDKQRFDMSLEYDDRLGCMDDYDKKLVLAHFWYAMRCYDGTGLGELESCARAVMNIKKEETVKIALSR